LTYIHSIQTESAKFKVTQNEMVDFLTYSLLDDTAIRKYKALQRDQSILYKYSVLPDFNASQNAKLLFKSPSSAPSTEQRMEIFKKEALQLSSKVCKATITDAGVKTTDITHIIGITCTGVYAPGLEVEMVQALGLSNHVQRHSVNFMGCHAAFHGLRLADLICRKQEDANVLLFSVELCSLHFRQDNSDDNLLSTFLFGDGAAALLLSGKKPTHQKAYLSCLDFDSFLLPEGIKDMSWDIGSHGFEMRLNRNVPSHIEQHMLEAFIHLLSRNNLSQENIKSFAIHPGGKNILKAFENGLHLTKDALSESYHILSEFGNMSSATVLFVLKRILDNPQTAKNAPVYAAAFGPGLSIESGLFEWHTNP